MDAEIEVLESPTRRGPLYGKWSEPGVPHRGWRYVDAYDSCSDGESLHMVCQMCEHQWIRYVHVMTHDNYPDELHCGCVCAERMAEEYVTPRAREADLRRKARNARRAALNAAERVLEARWKASGSAHRLRCKAGVATVFPNAGVFQVRLAMTGERPSFVDEAFTSVAAARNAATRALAQRLARTQNSA